MHFPHAGSVGTQPGRPPPTCRIVRFGLRPTGTTVNRVKPDVVVHEDAVGNRLQPQFTRPAQRADGRPPDALDAAIHEYRQVQVGPPLLPTRGVVDDGSYDVERCGDERFIDEVNDRHLVIVPTRGVMRRLYEGERASPCGKESVCSTFRAMTHVLVEHSEPELVAYPTSGTIVDDIPRNAAQRPDQIGFLRRTDGATWRPVSYRTFHDEVRAVAKGLMASGLGAGQAVGLMSRTRYEWTLLDYAILHAGGVVVPIYETSSAEQVEWILADSGATGVVVEGDKHRTIFDEVRGALPSVVNVWVIDAGAVADLMSKGASVSDADLDARFAACAPDDLATIIYTSGTTGRPKGAALTHGNLMYETSNVVEALNELFLVPNASTLLFLPIAHVFGRLVQFGAVHAHLLMGHTADIRDLSADLQSFKPTFLLAVPRVFEKVFNSAQQRATAEGKGRIFDRAAGVAIAYSRALDARSVGIGLRLQHELFDRLVYSKLRAAVGGNVRWAVSGGAPLGDRLGHFFRGVGITILEGYGLTETTAATTVNRPDALRVGSVGRPIPGATVAIADDGEVLMRGRHIFTGYWHNDQATADAIDDLGWFHSGDIGELDAEGFLRITGRKKELIVTAGGKNVAPAVLEDRIRSHWLISQVMVVGDNKPFIAALITIDPETFPTWKQQHGKDANATVADLRDDPDLNADVQTAVNDANKAVSNAEAVKKFRILETDWTEEGGQLTPSLKLKRNVVLRECDSEVAALYGS